MSCVSAILDTCHSEAEKEGKTLNNNSKLLGFLSMRT